MHRLCGTLAAATLFGAILGIGSAAATPGDPDRSFGGDGIVTALDEQAFDVTVDARGRPVVAGFIEGQGADPGDFTVARFTGGGALDSSFSGDGVFSTDLGSGDTDVANAVAVDRQGRIIAVGNGDDGSDDNIAVVRLTASGAPDPSFGGGDGILVEDLLPAADDRLSGLTIDPQGRIVAAGRALPSLGDLLVARVTGAGALDLSFGGGDGFATQNVGSISTDDEGEAVALDSQGRIYVAGHMDNGNDQTSQTVVARFTGGGVLDQTFSNDVGSPGRAIVDVSGSSEHDRGRAVVMGPGDRPIVGGSATPGGAVRQIALLRLTTAGAPDSSFSGDGRAFAGLGSVSVEGRDMVMDREGRLVVAGTVLAGPGSRIAAARFASGGTLDTSFGGDGIVSTDVTEAADFSDGVAVDPLSSRIVAAGGGGGPGPRVWALVRYEAVPRCGGRVPTIAGTPANDKLRGTAARDVIGGGAGNDTIRGLGKADVLCGEAGRDRLLGGKGKDRLFGGKGRDRLRGGPGRDKLRGGPGRDRQVQ